MEDATGVDTSNLAAKREIVALKAAAEKLDINKLLNFPRGFNNLKAKVDGLDVDKLKTVPVKVVKNTKFSKLNMKVNNLENRIPDASTLIQTNQYKADKRNLGKKFLKVRIRYLF